MSSLNLVENIPQGFYPERQQGLGNVLSRGLDSLSAIPRKIIQSSMLRQMMSRVEEVGPTISGMDQAALKNELDRIRAALRSQSWSPLLIGDCFAVVREYSDRLLGLRHYDSQLSGGWIMMNGMIAEMETGEGKTLTATLPACVMALAGVPVHIITVNDYLARRDAEWMSPVYRACGLTVGTITHNMSPVERQGAYGCDVTYCTNKEIVFDYLKDRLMFNRKPGEIQAAIQRLSQDGQHNRLLLRGLRFAIVDEADSVLIDEARTPLVISGQGDGSYETQVYNQSVELAERLQPDDDFTHDAEARTVALTDKGRVKLSQLVDGLDAIWSGRRRREELVTQALTALHLFNRDRDYLVRDGRVQIVDEFTGRILSDRTWERGLHQMVEVKEGCTPTVQKDTLARISYQRFFRRYYHLAGMTGTAREVAGELWSVYGLKVVRVNTNKPVQRKTLPCRLYRQRDAKWAEILERIEQVNQTGRPILVGVRSVEAAEHLSRMLSDRKLVHRVLSARQDEDEAEIIGQAGQHGQITVATNMAGRGTDIKLANGVDLLGGLHVIATEPHAARRIDRQLFGRCGRQGDPGSCELFASLEDEMLSPICTGTLFGVALTNFVMSFSSWYRGRQLLISLAQRRVERRHRQMRSELLAFDEMLQQTLAFSGQRE